MCLDWHIFLELQKNRLRILCASSLWKVHTCTYIFSHSSSPSFLFFLSKWNFPLIIMIILKNLLGPAASVLTQWHEFSSPYYTYSFSQLAEKEWTCRKNRMTTSRFSFFNMFTCTHLSIVAYTKGHVLWTLSNITFPFHFTACNLKFSSKSSWTKVEKPRSKSLIHPVQRNASN